METKEWVYKGRNQIYRTAGSGPVVMLLHGFGEDGRIWQHQFAAFPDHQLIVPDLPGSGGSERVEDMSMEGMADVIKELMAPSRLPQGGGVKAQPSLIGEAFNLQSDIKPKVQAYETADPMSYGLLKEFAKTNRGNPTRAEEVLWHHLRNHQLGHYKFRRQHLIGNFIADFVCLPEKLVVEIDGRHHQLPDNLNSDAERTRWLGQKGYRVVRFTNDEVLHQTENVLQAIYAKLTKPKKENLVSSQSEGCAVDSSPLGEAGGGCILVGHSMGGYIALAFAEKYPERLNALGLFHSTAFADNEAKKEVRRKGIAFIKEHGAHPFLKTTIPNLYAPATKAERPQVVEEAVVAAKDFSAEALIAYYEAMMARPDRTAVLRNAKVPVLFVLGKWDTAVPVEDGWKQGHLPQTAYIHLLQDSGHTGMIEEAEKANELLVEFVRTVEILVET